MRKLSLIVLAALSLQALSWAQGTGDAAAKGHDLRAQYRYQAGDKLRVIERREQKQEVRVRRGVRVVERDTQHEGVEQRYVLEVLEVSPEGDLLRALRTYESLRVIESDEAIPVEGIRILCRRDDDGMRYTAEKGVTIPAELQAVLDDAGDGSGPTENTGALFPEAPVAVGGRWECSPNAIAEVLELEVAHLLPESKVTGVLRSATPRPKATPLLHAEVAVNLRASSFQGLEGKRPFEFDLSCDLKLPAGGADPSQDVRIRGEVRGTAPSPAKDGTVLELDLTIDLTLKREALP